MRKSQPRTGFRPLRAGTVVAAAAVAVVAGTAAPAFGVTGEMSVDTAPIGGGTTTVVTAVGAFTTLNNEAKARFVASTANCGTTFGTSTTGIGTVAIDNDDTATVTIPALAAGSYKGCIYASATTVGGTTALTVNTTDLLVVSAASTTPTLSQTAGPVAGGNAITATGVGPYLASATTPAATFKLNSAGACNATYLTTGVTTATITKVAADANAGIAANTVASITVPSGLTASSAYKICIYAGNASNSALLATATYTPLPPATLSPTAGNSGGTNTITLTTASAIIEGDAPGAIFTLENCPATYTTGNADYLNVVTITKISNSKVALLVPATVEVEDDVATSTYNTCLYSNKTTGPLLAAPASYTVAPALDLGTAVASPAGGPAQGGTSVLFTGLEGIPEADDALLTATLGGKAMTDIRVIDDTSFRATTPASAAGPAALSVTTSAGTQNKAAIFTYSYGITTAPNAAVANTTPTLDIMGAGFNDLVVTNTNDYDDASSRVFLVTTDWFASASGGTNGAWATVDPVTACTGIVVISDVELICTLALNNLLDATTKDFTAATDEVADGTYSLVVVEDASDTSTLVDVDFSRISSGSTFTVADY
ncbi:IPT/TIG domain-containing protein [Actinoplanes sp. NPDC023936]|uniref:IPT/TIG domain-containing protein n=1 Tax=Actinoplanes sp. NPDC023936 TaxID=3154910 RepID=UPI0033E91B61